MADFEAETLAEHAALLGLITRGQAREAIAEAEDGTLEALTRSFLRKGLLTSWQLDRLMKEDPTGFFYGGCKVLFHLAEGTFARVYRGERTEGKAPVAIKVLRQRFSADPAAIERFNKEAEAGMKLRHPNIVRIIEYGEQDKRHFMVMEYVEGSNLRDFLKIRTRMKPKDALPLMLGLARGLKYSLDSGVTHRDIKGTNILISHTGQAKLVDFGLAAIEGEEGRMAVAHGQTTIDYSALERGCGSAKGDPRSDIYFLGCVFYQMITGQLPLPEVETSDRLAKMLKRSFGAIKPISEQRHAPDPEMSRIIDKMMKMDLKARYQTMDDVVADLERYEQHLISPMPKSPSAEFEDEQIFMQRAETDAGAAGPAPLAAKPVPLKNVLCVETQADIQDAFRKTLTKMGYRVLVLKDAEVAAERYREERPDVVIFDLDGLGEEGLEPLQDMQDSAHDDDQDLPALVLLGPKQKELRAKLPASEKLIVLVKPIKMKDVQDALGQLAPLEE